MVRLSAALSSREVVTVVSDEFPIEPNAFVFTFPIDFIACLEEIDANTNEPLYSGPFTLTIRSNGEILDRCIATFTDRDNAERFFEKHREQCGPRPRFLRFDTAAKLADAIEQLHREFGYEHLAIDPLARKVRTVEIVPLIAFLRQYNEQPGDQGGDSQIV
jgi:hypothetical protein